MWEGQAVSQLAGGNNAIRIGRRVALCAQLMADSSTPRGHHPLIQALPTPRTTPASGCGCAATAGCGSGSGSGLSSFSCRFCGGGRDCHDAVSALNN